MDFGLYSTGFRFILVLETKHYFVIMYKTRQNYSHYNTIVVASKQAKCKTWMEILAFWYALTLEIGPSFRLALKKCI